MEIFTFAGLILSLLAMLVVSYLRKDAQLGGYLSFGGLLCLVLLAAARYLGLG